VGTRSLGATLLALALLSAACSSPSRPAAAPSTTLGPSTTAPTPASTPTASPSGGSGPAHVMLVVLENREDTDVLGSSDAAYFNFLARRYGLATRSYGRTHPSLPNYLDLVSGSTQGIASDCTSCSVEGTTLADQLSGAGVAWKAYMEGMPSTCYQGASSGAGYAKKHNPFVYFRHLSADARLCDRVVPSSQMGPDLASASPPDFVWLTPNLCNDGHDCANSSVNAWLAHQMPVVMRSAWFKADGIIILTFDEGDSDAGCCGVATGGHIATVVVTDRVPGGRRWNQPVDPAGILATIEDLYGLGHLGEAARASAGNLLYLTGPPGVPPAA
jgi:hypothetical protein